MSNGVDFRKLALDLREQLTTAQCELGIWKTKACEAAEREAALREELAKANDKIDKAWRRSHELDDKACIPGAFDAWKRPVPQFLPYDFSGIPGASATQYCNGWNDCGGYWSAHAEDLQQRLTAAETELAQVRESHESMRADLIATDSKLTSAEQRNADVEKRAVDLIECLWGLELPGAGNSRLRKLKRALEALKPTESGASE